MAFTVENTIVQVRDIADGAIDPSMIPETLPIMNLGPIIQFERLPSEQKEHVANFISALSLGRVVNWSGEKVKWPKLRAYVMGVQGQDNPTKRLIIVTPGKMEKVIADTQNDFYVNYSIGRRYGAVDVTFNPTGSIQSLVQMIGEPMTERQFDCNIFSLEKVQSSSGHMIFGLPLTYEREPSFSVLLLGCSLDGRIRALNVYDEVPE